MRAQVSFPELACEFATLDVSNAIGSHRLNVDGVSTFGSKTVRKTRLYADGSEGEKYVDRLSPTYRQSDPAFAELEVKMVQAATDEDGTADYLYEDEDMVEQLVDEHSLELTPETHGAATKSAPLVMVAYMAKWCAWCKMLLPVWEHTAGIVKQKYGDRKVVIARVDCVAHQRFCSQEGIQGFPTIRVFRADGASRKTEMFMGDRTTDAVTKFIDGIVGDEDPTAPGGSATKRQRRGALAQLVKHDSAAIGCRLDGYVMVKKVPGTIELGAHAVGHSFNNVHLNLSHTVHHLTFGHELTEDDKAEVRSLVRGPDGGEWQEWSARFVDTPFTARTDNVTFEHYINAVLQTVEKGDFSIDLYDTTAHSHQYESSELSSVRISFVPSPFQVVIEEKRQPLADYLTNLMAIVGGCFTLASLLDKLVWGTQQAIKAGFGKQH